MKKINILNIIKLLVSVITAGKAIRDEIKASKSTLKSMDNTLDPIDNTDPQRPTVPPRK